VSALKRKVLVTATLPHQQTPFFAAAFYVASQYLPMPDIARVCVEFAGGGTHLDIKCQSQDRIPHISRQLVFPTRPN
jgi:hypothetical protein